MARSPAPIGRTRRPVAAALAGLLGALGAASVAPSALAQVPADSLVGRPVVGIEIAIDGRPGADPALVAVLETRPGRPLSLAEVRESVAHLMALERFADVTVVARPDPAGLVLVYELGILRRMTRVQFTGDTGLDPRDLQRIVEERVGRNPTVGAVAAIESAVVAACRLRGFAAARASAEVLPEPGTDRATLRVTLDAGPRLRVGTLAISTDGSLTEADVAERLALAPGVPFDQTDVERRAAALTETLRRAGFYEARVSVAAAPVADAPAADVTVSVRRGPRVTLEFRGDPIPARQQEALVPIRREGSVDQDLLEDSQLAIATYLRAQGYRDAVVDPPSKELLGDTLRIAFHVSRGPQFRIGQVEVTVDPPSASSAIPLASALEPGELFVQARLDAELARLAEQFRQAGYRQVQVKPELTDTRGSVPSDARTAIRIVVEPGARTVVEAVTLEGAAGLDASVLRRAIGTVAGGPLYDRQLAADREAIFANYADRGYQFARVEAHTEPAGPGRVTVAFEIAEGPQIRVDRILVVGNERISSTTIRRQLSIAEGEPLSVGALAESRRRLAALGLFRQIRLTERPSGDPAARDVVVIVDEAPATTVAYGIGAEGGNRIRHTGEAGDQAAEGFEIVPRGFFEIGRRNLWGKNRSVNLFTRASVRRQDQPIGADQGGGRFAFREYRAIASYREPAALGPRTELVATGFLERAIRSSYSFTRRGVAAQLAYRLGQGLSLSGRYSLDRSLVFDLRVREDDILTVDRVFPQVRISSLSISLTRDTRNDVIEPASGVLVLVDTELAARRFGSEVGFARTYVQGYAFRRLPGSRRVVLAGGARLGLSVGFTREVVVTDGGQQVVTLVKDVPVSRRFFAGGEGTHRAFATDRLGAPETLDTDGDPKGGRALLLVNGEVRVALTSWLSAVGFLDLGNVFASSRDVDLGELRPGLGTGVRVKTPLGPFRIDVGAKLNRRGFANGARERGFAIQFGIGQAF